MNALVKASAVLFQFSLLFVVYFMREQKPIFHPKNEDVLYSPAHGRIMKIFNYKDHICISIFLSPLNIHHQYIPINGTVRKVTYDYTGKFELAYEETKSRDNEKCITVIETKHGLFKIFQIAGTVARRIENNLTVNQVVKTGQNMGIIKLGSRVDVLVPSKARFRIEVKEGDIVDGTYSRLGHFF
jgi:phosphatidylserine decarboxylase